MKLTPSQKRIVKSNLYWFYRFYIATDFKENLPAPHIKKLAGKLSAVHKDYIQRLCVAMPPRHSKSSMVTLAYPLWVLFQDTDLNILIVNSEASLSEKFGIQLREYVRKIGPEFGVYLSEVKHSSTHLMFTNRKGELLKGSIRLVGASGSITGQDADIVIIDDPYKGFDDITPTLLQKKIDWFNTIIEQRLEPHSKLIILHTRWHSNDLQGYLKKYFPEDYDFIEFSAIQDDGNPLWPQRYTIPILEKKRQRMGDRLFESIYQQKPIDDTANFFAMEHIHWFRPEMEILYNGRGWDMASSSPGKNDFTAGVPMYVLEDNKSILITDYVHGQFGKETTKTVKDTVHLDGTDYIQVIETGVAAAGQILYDNWEEQLEGYFLERAKALPNNSKADRATPLKDYIYDGHVYVDITDKKLRQKFINEFKAFPDGEHDDIVDATAHIFNYMNNEFLGLDLLEIIEI